MTEIKMSERTAMRLLETDDCKVYLVGEKKPLTTKKGIITFKNSERKAVFIKEREYYVELSSIVKIFFVDRFGTEQSMTVDWERGDDK